MPGFVELLVIIVILISVFGFSRFPAIGEALGRAVHNFKSSKRSQQAIEVAAVDKTDKTDKSDKSSSAAE